MCPPRWQDAAQFACTKNAHWHRLCFARRGTRLARFRNHRMGTFLLGRNIYLNKKHTVGACYSLTENLSLLAEFTDTNSKAHICVENDRTHLNLGSHLSFRA